jgi:hypothetical protein
MNNIDFIMIHIGKCGGNTVHNVLHSLGYKIKQKHIEKPIFNPTRKYLILIRNPISRLISAFNWRFHLVCTIKRQENRFKGEKLLLEKFKDINNLAEKMYRNDGILKFNFSNPSCYIHHIYEDINFYMSDFLDTCKPENIHGVILTETINDDLKRLFNVDVDKIPHKLKNRKYNTTLSELGYSNLKKYLHKDYACIEKMYEMKLITKTQYDILSV